MLIILNDSGLLLSNANALGKGFPTAVPNADETYSDILRLAACFQDPTTGLALTIGDSFSSNQNARKAFIDSSPGNKIVGWNQYLILLLWYGVAIIGETVRYIRRGVNKGGRRRQLATFLKTKMSFGLSRSEWFYRAGKFIVALYLVGGITVSAYTVVQSGLYMTRMRSWVAHSGWLKIENGKNPEDDATTFGQLVPIFLTALIVWSLLQLISGMIFPCLLFVPFSFSSCSGGLAIGADPILEKATQKRAARRTRKDLENSGGINGQVEVHDTAEPLETPIDKKPHTQVEAGWAAIY